MGADFFPYIISDGFRLVSAIMASKMTLTGIRFHSYQEYMTGKLSTLDWVDWICLSNNSPVYCYVPPKSK